LQDGYEADLVIIGNVDRARAKHELLDDVSIMLTSTGSLAGEIQVEADDFIRWRLSLVVSDLTYRRNG
jgi:hypothetical protein